MTRDEWTDEAARMTPRQKEAMAYYGRACCHTLDPSDELNHALEEGLHAGDRSPAALLNRVYSGAIPDQWG